MLLFRPNGRKLRSKNEIREFAEKNHLDIDVESFGFARPRKNKIEPERVKKKKKKPTPPPPPVDRVERESTGSNDSTTVDPVVQRVDPVAPLVTFDCSFVASDDSNMSEPPVAPVAVVAPVVTPVVAPDSPPPVLVPTAALTPPPSVIEPETPMDLDRCLVKTFKIERPISFSCF